MCLEDEKKHHPLFSFLFFIHSFVIVKFVILGSVGRMNYLRVGISDVFGVCVCVDVS